MLIVVHHLAIDAVSWRVILEELFGELQPPATSSYRRWSTRLAEYAASDEARDELAYWLSDERMNAAPLFVIDPTTNVAGNSIELHVTLPAAETSTLLRSGASRYRCTIEELALTALATTIRDAFGTSTFVDLEWHGRDGRFADVDVSGTVGWFTAIAPLLLTLPAHADRAAAVAAVKEQLRAMPHHGMSFGALRHLASDPFVRDLLAAAPRPQISFNYLGQVDALFPPGVRPAAESVGLSSSPAMPRAHVLEVNAIVIDGCLRVDWTVPPSLAETTARLSEAFLRTLAAFADGERARPLASLHGIDDFFEREIRAWDIPGLAVGIVRDGEIVHLQGYGARNAKRPEPVTPRTLFELGSITKVFTATWLAALQRRGLLSWDEPVSRWIPELRLADPEGRACRDAARPAHPSKRVAAGRFHAALLRDDAP